VANEEIPAQRQPTRLPAPPSGDRPLSFAAGLPRRLSLPSFTLPAFGGLFARLRVGGTAFRHLAVLPVRVQAASLTGVEAPRSYRPLAEPSAALRSLSGRVHAAVPPFARYAPPLGLWLSTF
jgi:hypothetical protein